MGKLFKRNAYSLTAFSKKNYFGKTFQKNNIRKIILGFGLCFGVEDALAQQVVYQHDFGSVAINTHPYISAPGIMNTSLSNSVWSNTTGTWNSYTGSSGQAIALKNNAVITINFQVAAGYYLSVAQFNFWSQRSSQGATNWSMSVNGIAVGSGVVPLAGTSTGNLNVANPVSGLTGLITLEIALTGATSGSGTFRLDDFTLIGTVTANETYYRSFQNGDWSSSSTWESSPDNINWYPATNSPTKDVETILIQSGHTLKISTPVSLDQTIITGILELQNGGVLNINDGAGDDFLISSGGIFKVITTANYIASVNQPAAANISVATGGKIIIGNGISSMGGGYESFVTSPVNKWKDGAVFEFNDNNVFAIAGLTYFPNVASNEIPIFRVSKVNGSIAAGVGNDFYLNGIIDINSDITFSGAGKKYFRNGIRGTATITQKAASGKFFLTAPGAVLDGASLKIDLTQPIDLASATFIPSGAYVTILNQNINNNIIGNVFEINGTLDITNNEIKNLNGKVILNGTFRTAHPGGFSGSGSSIVSGNIVLNPGCIVELYANGNQALNGRPDFKNIILSGGGIKNPAGPFKPNGTLTIKDNAIFDCTGNINGINIGDDNTSLIMKDNSRLIASTFGPNPPMNGTYDLTGGVIEFRGSLLTPQTIRNQTYQNIEITGSNINNSDGNIVLKSGGTFVVKNGGVFSINDNTIAGPTGIQTVVIESGGLFKTGNTKGFHGFPFATAPKFNSSLNDDIENIILQPNSTVEYSRASPPLASGDQLITNSNGLGYQNLILSGSGNKIAPTGDLVIKGNFAKAGTCTFIHNSGKAIFNGSTVQTYISNSPQVGFNVLKNENIFGLNINNNLSVYNQFAASDNSILNVNADITILSTQNQTASISQLPLNVIFNYGIGRFVVERYINTNFPGGHGKSWQLLSTPAFGETIFNSWQEKSDKNISGYGTWITGPAGITNGFDGLSNTPSMKTYMDVNNNWKGIVGTGDNLESEKGYMIFVRGDRKANAFNSPPTPTVLRTRGKLYTPKSPAPASYVLPGKFQSIGNPFASAIDFTKINRSTEIENSFRVWDPVFSGEYGLGGYQTISAATGYKAVPGNTSIYNSVTDYRIIQSGQAFFVNNFSSNIGSVSFSEDCKVQDAHHLVHREMQNDTIKNQILFTNLVDQNDKVVDGNAVSFSNKFSNKIDSDDAIKINNPNENFGIKRNERVLVVEARQIVSSTDTVFYNLKNLSGTGYKLFFSPENFQVNTEVFLVDRFLKTEKPVFLKDTSSYNFLLTPDEASKLEDRFFLIFKQKVISCGISVNASKKDMTVNLDWWLKNVENVKTFQIEHAIDTIRFSKIKEVSVGTSDNANYNHIHTEPQSGTNFYRVRIDKSDGSFEYSEVAKVLMPELEKGITIYPIPVQDYYLNIQFNYQPEGNYLVRLINISGQEVDSKLMKHAGGNGLMKFILKKNMAHGIYYLEVKNPQGGITRYKIIY